MGQADASERFLASIAQFLIDGGEEDAASIVLSCSLSGWESGDSWMNGDEMLSAVHVNFTGPRPAYEILTREGHPITKAVQAAIKALLPPDEYLRHLTITAEQV